MPLAPGTYVVRVTNPDDAGDYAEALVTLLARPVPDVACEDGGQRPLTTLFAEALQGECLTLALCLLLTRSDGVVYGFTTLDQDLEVDGQGYQAADGLGLSNLRIKAGTGVDNTEISGLQVTDRVVADDMRGGRYDGGRISLFAVDYENLGAGTMVLLTGHIGSVGFSDGAFNFEARSLTQRLSQQVGDLYSPLCRVREFCDDQCGLDIADFTYSRTVTGTPTRASMVFAADSHPDDTFTYGLVRFTSGLNDGISRPVRSHVLAGGTAVIETQEPFPFNIAAGDVADLIEGCNRTTARCVALANMENFRGEPHVPRADTMISVSRSGA